jgi:hypothetical protein
LVRKTGRHGNDAPKEMDSALRGASVVLVVVTTDFLCSKYCLGELLWACDETQRRSQLEQQGQQSAAALTLVPIFYHDQDPIVGFGVDSFQKKPLQRLLRQHHAAASKADHARWLDALLFLAKRTGIRQDSTGRCAGDGLRALADVLRRRGDSTAQLMSWFPSESCSAGVTTQCPLDVCDRRRRRFLRCLQG